MAYEFGKYILQRKLAEGGMAEVFLAKQSGMEGFEKPVVIKRILSHLSSEPQFIEMFLNEARVAARLSHPSIVHVFDFGRIDDQYYLAMEFIHGEDLRAIAKAGEKHKKRPPFAIVCRIIADMLGALHYAHTRAGLDGKPLGLVHRDVSPQNILVTYEGGIKLVDFGIAKATTAQTSQQTQAGMLKGKYAYMSPEQCRGRPLDARSDVFAVGILLWELISWKRLFRRESDLATLVAVADEPIPLLSQVCQDIPVELDKICARALARPLEERYATAQAMQGDLEGLIRKYGWESDTIRIQQYMRDVFADKIRLQDDAIRAAGVGSIEDFLVRVDEGTRMAWMELPVGGSKTPSGANSGPQRPMYLSHDPLTTLEPGALIAKPAPPMKSGAHRSVAGPAPAPARRDPTGRVPGRQDVISGTTLRSAVGQRVLPPDATTGATMPPPSGWKRLLVVLGTGTVIAGGVLAAMFWPPADAPAETPAATARPIAEVAKVRVMTDVVSTVSVDGKAEPPAKETEVQVSAHAQHQLVVKAESGLERKVMIPPLEPGEVHSVRLRLGN